MRQHYALQFILLFEFRKKTKCLIITIALGIIRILEIHAQGNIALQNFETSGSNYNYTNTNGSLQTGSSSNSDRPSTATFYLSNNTAFRASNTTAILNFENKTGLIAYQLKKISIRLAAFSIGSTSNGMDATDKVTVSVSLNGGSSFSDELTVKGNSNAVWHYTTGTGMATVNYDGNNSATEFAPASGGNRTTDGYSTLTINLPDTCTQVKLKITMINDSNNEAWFIDDVFLSSCVAPIFSNCPTDITINNDLHFCRAQVIYNAIASGSPGPAYAFSFSGETVGSGPGTGSGLNFNVGNTNATITAINACGIATCAFTIKVIDTEVPVINCPAPVNYTTAIGYCGAITSAIISLGIATTSDNCGTFSLNNNAPNSYPLGQTNVTWTATDIYSNTNTCIQYVNIIPYKCGQPSQLFANDITATSATIKWKTNTCATDFQLRIRKEISTGVWSAWSDWNNTNEKLEYPFSGLSSNSFYHYQIRTVCGSTFSKIVNGWFRTIPN